MRKILIPVMALAGLAACSEPPPPPEAPVARPVKMVAFGAAEWSATREYSGTVSPAQSSDMAFEVPGKIAEFPVAEGQEVEADQVLAKLDPRDYEAGRDRALAVRNAAQADFARYDQAFKENAVTRQDLDLAKRELELANAELRTSRKALEDTVLVAPFAGRVARKLVDDFANVQAKEPVLIIQDESSLEMKVDIPERDWASAAPGLSLEERTARARPRVQIASFPDREFAARITEIATTADPVTRTYRGTAAFDNPPDLSITSGMTGKIVISLPEDAAEGAGSTSLPANAVLSDEGGSPYVWVVDPATMTVSRRSVQIGDLSGADVSVTSGLQSGDRVAISGVNTLREGMEIRAFGD